MCIIMASRRIGGTFQNHRKAQIVSMKKCRGSQSSGTESGKSKEEESIFRHKVVLVLYFL